VWNNPTAHFRYTASPCANGAVQFQDSSWSYQATITSWLWEFEPYQYSSGQNPSHVYYAIDSCYDVRLIVTDIRGCIDTTVIPVCVPPELSVSFDYQQACFGQPTVFSPLLITPAAPADSLVSFSWNFGDPASGGQNTSNEKYPEHTFSQPGFYTVSFTATDQFGCESDVHLPLQVYDLPVASFTADPGNCDSTIVFTSTSIPTAAPIAMLYWDFGDGTLDTVVGTVATVPYRYGQPGNYLVTLTVEDQNGCRHTVSDSVLRSPCIVAAYFASDTLLCQNYTLAFADLSYSDGVIAQWEWDWGDTTANTLYSSYQPLTTHIYTSAGTYLVQLRVTTIVSGTPVSDSTSRVITILPSPLAGFVTQNNCYQQPTQFTDTTQANGATLLTYRWQFADPLSLADTAQVRNPQYTYPAPGSYSPQLIVANQHGCLDTATMAMQVYGLPDAGWNTA